MNPRRELLWFSLCLAALVTAFFHQSLLGGKVLSPADVLLVSASFRQNGDLDYEPANRLLMDPVLQFQPWIEFNRAMIRSGQLPLWNPYAGCGTPHLANGQSAVFDPFNLIAYLGPSPASAALAWMAAARLFTAGVGMFLLARLWNLGVWGRWFAGLLYPFTGFLVVWLLYPVTNVAIWMPWLFWATERLLRHPTRRGVGLLAIITGVSVFGGHIQTTAHALLALGLFAAWRTQVWRRSRSQLLRLRRLLIWSAAMTLGLSLAAVQILPLAAYLSRSPVWSDRQQELAAWWAPSRPRLLDAVCTAIPYAYGSQRRGQPHLAPALKVQNLNECSGGYTGLAALLWLAPLAVITRPRCRLVRFLTALVLFALVAAFQIWPADNLLRLIPVLNVTDNRRLTLWVAFGLPILAGMGIDRIESTNRLPRLWRLAWLGAALALVTLALAIPSLQQRLLTRATAHYKQAARETPGADESVYLRRAERQVDQTVRFLPFYYGVIGAELAALALLASFASRRQGTIRLVRPALFAITVVELAGFGYELNPSILDTIQDLEPPVIARLREMLPPGGRALGLGEELPPNVLMRFGLSDPRNYDSVELTRSLDWFAPLYSEKAGARTSRREITWSRAASARDRLEQSGVGAIVASVPPPPGLFNRVEPVANVWIARLDPEPWASTQQATTSLRVLAGDPYPKISMDAAAPDLLTVRITNSPGWTASVNGKPAQFLENLGPFLQLPVPPGTCEIVLKYQPAEFLAGLTVTVLAGLVTILVLTGIARSAIPGIIQQGLGRTRAPELG